jgi:hypothetical protein
MADMDGVRARLERLGFGEDVELAIADLEVPREFQRKLKPRNWTIFVRAIFGRVYVAEVTSVKGKRLKKPRLVIVDGQHRSHEAERFGHHKIPCVLFHDMALEDVAAIFALDNSMAVSLPPQDEFRAACMAEDSDALALDAALLERGLDAWPVDGTGRAPHLLRPISSVRKLQRDISLEHTMYTLDVIRDVWPWPTEDDSNVDVVWSDSPHVRIIRGFGQFLRPEKKVQKSARSKVTVIRRWNPADRVLLVEALRGSFTEPDLLGLQASGMDKLLALAEKEAPGGGGGGGSLGMELVLRRILNKARFAARQEVAA